jgi:hypothetical protein
MAGAASGPINRLAVVLFNLGGPDNQAAVEPFLFNLFNDPAIVRLPKPVRWLVAKLISRRRAPVARKIYAHLGGGSPLLANTKAQGQALQAALKDAAGEVRVFIAMRYWHPFADETAKAVREFSPDRVLLLPLYPNIHRRPRPRPPPTGIRRQNPPGSRFPPSSSAAIRPNQVSLSRWSRWRNRHWLKPGAGRQTQNPS